MNDQYVLMGHVVGESITFLVRIHPNEVLASLQEIIHEKKRRVFENVTADELIVYEVDSSSLKVCLPLYYYLRYEFYKEIRQMVDTRREP